MYHIFHTTYLRIIYTYRFRGRQCGTLRYAKRGKEPKAMARKTLSNVTEKQLCEIFHDKVSYVEKKFARSVGMVGHSAMLSIPGQIGISLTYINVKSMESEGGFLRFLSFASSGFLFECV